MAAGLVYHNIVTKTGVDFTIAGWAPDTALPDENIIPSSVLVDIAGAEVLGQVTASPAATSVLGRLKTIADAFTTNALWGALTEAAPASDTASSGLNGRLQRIAQNLTTMMGRAVAQLGARTIAQSPAVNLATDDLLVVATGAAADAASATGSLHAKLRAIATALGVTAFDLGIGTGGSRTLRVAIDAAQTNTGDYEWVDAGQTDQAMGTGATGDYLDHVLIVPGTTSPGQVAIQDGAGTARVIFTGGASSVSNLVPFSVPIGAVSTAGSWQITTGSNVTAIGFGNFT